ncbi:MAG: hypothetical protein M3Z04_07170 [Chloroflexota bacterium]|nr:hypothetical protein [Chloroflexota bacterium]
MTRPSRWTALPATGLLLLALAACDASGSGSTAPTAVIAVPTAAAGSEAAPTTDAVNSPPTATADTVAPTAATAGGRRKKFAGTPVDGSLDQAAKRYMFDVNTVHFVYDQTPKAGREQAVFSVHAEGDIDRSVAGATRMRFTVTQRRPESENGDWLAIEGKDLVTYHKVGGAWQVADDALAAGSVVYRNLSLPWSAANPIYGEEANLSTVSSSETLAGQDTIHYHFFHGAAGTPERMDTDVWVSKATGLYVRIQTVRADDTVTWDYSNYDAPVSIADPAP